MQWNDRFTRGVHRRSVVGPDLGPRRCWRVNGTRQGAALQIQLHGSGEKAPRSRKGLRAQTGASAFIAPARNFGATWDAAYGDIPSSFSRRCVHPPSPVRLRSGLRRTGPVRRWHSISFREDGCISSSIRCCARQCCRRRVRRRGRPSSARGSARCRAGCAAAS
jgi:hypothetical protein